MSFDPKEYGPQIAELLKEERLAELGPGTPNSAMKPKLETLTPEKIIPGAVDEEMAAACCAGLWLHHDFLDRSHKISQEISSTAASPFGWSVRSASPWSSASVGALPVRASGVAAAPFSVSSTRSNSCR